MKKKIIEFLEGLNEIMVIKALKLGPGTEFNNIGCYYYLNIIDYKIIFPSPREAHVQAV